MWGRLLAGDVTPWQARVIAQSTVALTPQAAAYVDEQTAWCANRVTPAQLIRVVDHARARFMPEHLAVEVEAAQDRRHVTFVVDQVSFDGTIVVKPVIDLRRRLETPSYTPTDRIRDFVIARDRTCVFPWCGRNARHGDLDHIVPFDHADPARGGPTSTDNLAALCRRHLRKTKGRWRYEMTSPGLFVWTSPLGHTYLRDHTGSRRIGHDSSPSSPMTASPRAHPAPARPVATTPTPRGTRTPWGHRHAEIS